MYPASGVFTGSEIKGGGVYFGQRLLTSERVWISDNTATQGGDIFLGSNGSVYEDPDYTNFYVNIFEE